MIPQAVSFPRMRESASKMLTRLLFWVLPNGWFLSPIVSSNDEGVEAVKMGSRDLGL